MFIFFFSKNVIHLDVYDLDLNGFRGFWQRAIFLSKSLLIFESLFLDLFEVNIFYFFNLFSSFIISTGNPRFTGISGIHSIAQINSFSNHIIKYFSLIINVWGRKKGKKVNFTIFVYMTTTKRDMTMS
jgi:hypothetical protein